MAIKFEKFHECRWLPDVGEYDTYGICVFETGGTHSTPVDWVPDLSDDPELVESIVWECNSSQADPIHLREIIDDFLSGARF